MSRIWKLGQEQHDEYSLQSASFGNQTMKGVQETLDASVSAAASKVTGAGSAVTLFGWATSSTLGMWVGIVIGIAGLLVNWYFKHKSDRRAQAAHDAYMFKIRQQDLEIGHQHKAHEADE